MQLAVINLESRADNLTGSARLLTHDYSAYAKKNARSGEKS